MIMMRSLIIMKNRRNCKHHHSYHCCNTTCTTITTKKSCLLILIEIITMMLLPHLLPLVYASHTFTYTDNNTPTITTITNTATATISTTTTTTTTTTLREFLMQHDDNNDGSSDDENENDGAGGVYLAMAPAFFGFYGYFGALGGIEDALFPVVPVPVAVAESIDDENKDTDDGINNISLLIKNKIIKGVSGASSGAMAAVLLAAGISPNVAATFVSTLELKHFDDWFGLGSLMKGDKFESLMHDFMLSSSPIIINKNDNSNDSDDNNSNNSNNTTHSSTTTIPKRQLQLHFEEAYIPVAISVTDILPKYGTAAPFAALSFWNPWSYFYASLPKPKIIKEGPMSRAVRASACFPGLFQPVGWIDYYTSSNSNGNNNHENNHNNNNSNNSNDSNNNNHDFSLLIDGGIFDWAGYNGLKEIINTKSATIPIATTNSNSNSNSNSNGKKIRVMNMVMGGFGTHPHGPLEMTQELFSSSESQDSHHSQSSTATTIDSVLSLSIINLPSCGPFSMSNGPIAINAAKNVIRDIMDRPIQSMPIMMSSSSSISENNDDENDDSRSGSSHHYFLEIDASSYY